MVAARRLRAKAPSGSGEALRSYAAKRDFAATPEPRGRVARTKGHRFVIQKHDARRLHYDLRLELDGVLKSWAVTRGPSLVPGEKRLAVHTEDHPLEYLTFEGVIPEGSYGAGTMIVWDRGRWVPDGDPREAYARGRLTFTLEGERLRGRWHLVRTRAKPGQKDQWLLIKSEDEHARTPEDPDVLDEHATSVLSGRTNADLAAAGPVRPDHAARAKTTPAKTPQAKTPQGKTARARTSATPPPDPSRVAGAKRGILPVFIAPSLATLVAEAPNGEAWLHEVKFDGYRLQARIDAGRVKLLTRRGLDWTERFPDLVPAFRNLSLGSALIDGEVVVEDEAGRSSFSRLQEALSTGRSDGMAFYAFDLLYLEGFRLDGASLVDRKALLERILAGLPVDGTLRYSGHIERDGAAMLRHACRMSLEGIVSKRKDRPYASGRSQSWLKTKCSARQEFVIAGYVPSTTAKHAIGSLVLGVYEDGRLVHVGRVGTGFSQSVARDLWRALEPLRRPDPPFAGKLPAEAVRGARWVEPRLVAEVEFRSWTADGILRHAAFKGLREDRAATEVVRERAGAAPPGRERPGRTGREPTIRLTHPDRVLWPDVGLTKQGLADLYEVLAGWVLPHVVDRPLSLVRCPSGIEQSCFFQKHAWAGLDTAAIRRVAVGGEEMLAIADLDGLLALVQAGVLEIHPWGSRLETVETPDRITMDLDPGEGAAWRDVVQAAREVRERLNQAGLPGFVKTTGGKGLHVVVPLRPRAGWDEVKAFAQELAQAMAQDSPDRYTAVLAKRAREGRVFIDYLRNGRGATAVAAYSTRARPGAPIATPLAWDELETVRAGHQFRADTILTRLRHLAADPWSGLEKAARPLPSATGRSRGQSGARRRRSP